MSTPPKDESETQTHHGQEQWEDGYERRKEVLHQTIRGWVAHFKLADAKKYLVEMDGWLRRRIRMCIWKSWKKPRTRVKNLVKCGKKPYLACQWGNSRGVN